MFNSIVLWGLLRHLQLRTWPYFPDYIAHHNRSRIRTNSHWSWDNSIHKLHQSITWRPPQSIKKFLLHITGRAVFSSLSSQCYLLRSWNNLNEALARVNVHWAQTPSWSPTGAILVLSFFTPKFPALSFLSFCAKAAPLCKSHALKPEKKVAAYSLENTVHAH